MSKHLKYIGHMTEVYVPFHAAGFMFTGTKPVKVPDDLAKGLLAQPDKFAEATPADIKAAEAEAAKTAKATPADASATVKE